MALNNPFLNKRDAEFALRGQALSHAQQAVASHAAPPTTPILDAVASPPTAVPVVESGSKLTVGPNIKLKGVEITDCDTLVVEGLVEATMDSRVIRIAEMGAFRGSAEIDVAEIRGEFSGNLTVREKLVIYATGKVSGTIHYGKLVIEEGGQLTGQIEFGTATKPVAANKPAIKAAA